MMPPLVPSPNAITVSNGSALPSSFPPGSLFSLRVETSGRTVVSIPDGLGLSVTAVSGAGTACLRVSSDENREALPMFSFGDEQVQHVVAGGAGSLLGIDGPRTLRLEVSGPGRVHLFGTVSSAGGRTAAHARTGGEHAGSGALVAVADGAPAETPAPLPSAVPAAGAEATTTRRKRNRRKSKGAVAVPADPVVGDVPPGADATDGGTAVPVPAVTAEVVAPHPEKNGGDSGGDGSAATATPSSSKKRPADREAEGTSSALSPSPKSTKKKKGDTPKKILSERRLDGGVVVRDTIIGDGPSVRPGRMASINYVGSLKETGVVFDRKKNRTMPFQFRVGAGQVIRGLERGLKGMRSGGERTVVVPPELGYGRKGAGNGTIPGNSTLIFEVILVDVGAK